MAKKRYRIEILDGTVKRDETVARLESEILTRLVTAYPKTQYEIQPRRTFVHSRESFEEILAGLRRVRGKGHIGLHFVGHGEIEIGRTLLKVGEQTINLRDPSDLQLFRDIGRGVDGSWILLSCCDVGADGRTLRKLRNVSGCGAVFAYQGVLYDYQAFVMDLLFYHLLLVDTPERMMEDQMTWSLIRRRLGVAASRLFIGAQIHGSY